VAYTRAIIGMVHFAPGNMVTVRAMRIGNSRLTQLWKPLRPCLNCHQVSEPCPIIPSQTIPHSNSNVICMRVANCHIITISIVLPTPSIMFRSFMRSRGVSAIPSYNIIEHLYQIIHKWNYTL